MQDLWDLAFPPIHPVNPGSRVDEMQHRQLTHTIIGCAMEVHSTLGSGFQEVIYQWGPAMELEKKDIPYVLEYEILVNPAGELIPRRN